MKPRNFRFSAPPYALIAILGLIGLLLAACRKTEPPVPANDPTPGNTLAAFYDSGVAEPADLPADGIYPRGKKLAFMGYSGDPARDLANGFTVAGPVYGDQLPYLDRCAAHGWPVVAHIGPKVTFRDGDPAKYKPDPTVLRELVRQEVAALAPRREIIWWAIHPEELRPWRKEEMLYLETVAAAIRETDPQDRPIFLYNPNNRDAGSLEPIARHVDVVAKGCYVNLSGKKRDRVWVRWSVEQELAAIQAAGSRPGSFALVMPELCKDPEPGEEKEIRAWVRHDVYLGLIAGARGVKIWSLFKRREVKNTWQIWYDAYAECARELNGEPALARVLLFGRPEDDFHVAPVDGAQAESPLKLGGTMEPETSSPEESREREIAAPTWTAREFAFGQSRYLFIVHSGNEPAAFHISGWPTGSIARSAFDNKPIDLMDGKPLRLDLPPYGVAALRFQASTTEP